MTWRRVEGPTCQPSHISMELVVRKMHLLLFQLQNRMPSPTCVLADWNRRRSETQGRGNLIAGFTATVLSLARICITKWLRRLVSLLPDRQHGRTRPRLSRIGRPRCGESAKAFGAAQQRLGDPIGDAPTAHTPCRTARRRCSTMRRRRRSRSPRRAVRVPPPRQTRRMAARSACGRAVARQDRRDARRTRFSIWGDRCGGAGSPLDSAASPSWIRRPPSPILRLQGPLHRRPHQRLPRLHAEARADARHRRLRLRAPL